MIFLEVIKSRLTAAVMLKDELTATERVVGDVYLRVSGIKNSPLPHSTGYFLLTDVPEGEYEFVAGGNFYREKAYSKSLKPSQLFYDIALEPGANYPFPAGITVLKGKIVDEADKPVSGAAIKVEDMTENTLSEDNGCFFIIFKNVNADKNITLDISKEGYKPAEAPVLLKKKIITRTGSIRLTSQ